MPSSPLPRGFAKTIRARITKVKINYAQLRKDFHKSSRALQKVVKPVALQAFEFEKQKFLKDFEEHGVTQEVEGGPDAPNLSGTLGGITNLFSFIGFHSGDSPTEPVKELIRRYTYLRMNPRVIHDKRGVLYKYSAAIPSLSDFFDVTPFPDNWQGGSWLKGIEKGISGINYLLRLPSRGRMLDSRSGGAVQVRNRIRTGARFRNSKYFTQIYNKFVSRLNKGVK
jgi:hypothetical protein